MRHVPNAYFFERRIFRKALIISIELCTLAYFLALETPYTLVYIRKKQYLCAGFTFINNAMKRFFTAVALCLTMIAVQAVVPAPIQNFVNQYNTEVAGLSEDGVRFGKASISGYDIIIPMYMDDTDLVEAGFTLAEAIDMMGGEELFKAEMLASIFEEGDTSNDPDIANLKRYQYNLLVRMVGTASKTHVDVRIRHQEL